MERINEWTREEGNLDRLEVKKSQRHSPNGSVLRPTGADGGRLGPSIIGGGDGAPPLTGEGPYESPVATRASIHSGDTGADAAQVWADQLLVPLRRDRANLNHLHQRQVTLARACSLSRVGSEERSPPLVELGRQHGQSVGGKRHQKQI